MCYPNFENKAMAFLELKATTTLNKLDYSFLVNDKL